MTIFKNVETGRFYRIDHTGKRVLWLDSNGFWRDFWFRSEYLRPADLTGYPFIAVNSTNC